jgi:uncharacterized protein (TIGR02757 family)
LKRLLQIRTRTKELRRDDFERLYLEYNRPEFIHPDPVGFVFRYSDPLDREIAALIASALAYGNVSQIHRSVSTVLDRLDLPSETIMKTNRRRLAVRFQDFKHRFTTGKELAAVLLGLQQVVDKFGSLESCFTKGIYDADEDIREALCVFVAKIRNGDTSYNSLLPNPGKGSACKRLNLFLKWMVRKDDVDPGGWNAVDKSRLIIPLDTHMHRIGRILGMTQRKSADLKTALEVTAGFRAIEPSDPTKYDFALTRLGMKYGASVGDHLN